jgi:hypothetical protein
LLAYDTEVIGQYISSIDSYDGEVTGFTIISVQVSLLCANESCPTDSENADARQRKLGRCLEDKTIADIIFNKVLKGKRDYFAGVKCVRISIYFDYVDQSAGCKNYPVVGPSAGIATSWMAYGIVA